MTALTLEAAGFAPSGAGLDFADDEPHRLAGELPLVDVRRPESARPPRRRERLLPDRRSVPAAHRARRRESSRRRGRRARAEHRRHRCHRREPRARARRTRRALSCRTCASRLSGSIATTLGRGAASPPSGQWLCGLVAEPASPGCCKVRNNVAPSAVNSQPHTSAPTGPLMNWRTWPRSGPSVGQTKQPSLLSPGWFPSVTIQRLPSASKPRLSGFAKALSSLASVAPPKYVSFRCERRSRARAVTPRAVACRSARRRAGRSPNGTTSRPHRRPLDELENVARRCSVPAGSRGLVRVSSVRPPTCHDAAVAVRDSACTTNRRCPLRGLTATSSGRSSGVAPSRSAASRQRSTTSACDAKPRSARQLADARRARAATIRRGRRRRERATYSVPSSSRSRFASGRVRIEASAAHELVEVLELLIVAHVDDGTAVARPALSSRPRA